MSHALWLTFSRFAAVTPALVEPSRPVDARSPRRRRVGELLAVVWLLSLADLCFTLWAHFFTPFVEMNPIADALLRRGLVPSLVLYKLVLTLIGSSIFWRLRDHGRAELGLWATAAAYVLLALRWADYTAGALDAISF